MYCLFVTPKFKSGNFGINTLAVKGKKAKVKYKKTKKKSQSLVAGKVISFTDRGQGTLRYSKVKGNKKITVNKSNGTVTVKKKIKRGTYKAKVKVMATGSMTYLASNWKPVTITIKVR
jgi:hypothetical protein